MQALENPAVFEGGAAGAAQEALALEYLELVEACAHTYAPEPPYCTYGLRVPAPCVLYVPEAQGSLLPGPHALYVRRTRTSLGRAVRTAYRAVHPRWRWAGWAATARA